MADTKLSALTELAATPATGDEFYIRDISESTADESKRITYANLDVPTQAVQSDIEARTNEDTYIPPDLMQYHPGVAKAWVQFHSTEVIDGTSYNVASISHVGTGRHTVNFTTDFSSATYVGVGLGCDNIMGSRNNDDWTAGVAHMEFRDFAGSLVATGSTTRLSVRVAFFGDQ